MNGGSREGTRLTFRANAKINLFLNVLDQRPDGYHNIETVYQSVGFADRLQFEVRAEGFQLECGGEVVPAGSDNLIVRAAQLMYGHFPDRVAGLRIDLDKRIPPESGLGGGSADAAVTLRACNALFDLGLSAERLRAMGTQLGMDIPFLVEGGCAVGTQRGERLEALPVCRGAWAVIAAPRTSVSTRWAYAELDNLPAPPGPSLRDFVARMTGEPLEAWAAHCYNAFERVVFRAHPRLEQLRDALLAAGCAGALLTGSGSAVVGLTGRREQAVAAAQAIRDQCKLAEAVPFLAGTTSEPESE